MHRLPKDTYLTTQIIKQFISSGGARIQLEEVASKEFECSIYLQPVNPKLQTKDQLLGFHMISEELI